jgi:hypothetical protein
MFLHYFVTYIKTAFFARFIRFWNSTSTVSHSNTLSKLVTKIEETNCDTLILERSQHNYFLQRRSVGSCCFQVQQSQQERNVTSPVSTVNNRFKEPFETRTQYLACACSRCSWKWKHLLRRAVVSRVAVSVPIGSTARGWSLATEHTEPSTRLWASSWHSFQSIVLLKH